MKTITLTMKELEKLKILVRLKANKIKQIDAAKLLEKSERQVRRLIKRYQIQSASRLTSLQRGSVSNQQLPEEVKSKALALNASHYAIFRCEVRRKGVTRVHNRSA